MREGVLMFDPDSERMDARFDVEDYYGGLHCGERMEVYLKGKWQPSRIEMNFKGNWYLVGIDTDNLVGLRVRI